MAPRRPDQQKQQTPSRFASKGAFDALAPADDEDDAQSEVSEGEDGEGAGVSEAATGASSAPAAAASMTRTQQKKMAKEARQAKKAQKQTNGTLATSASTVPSEGVAAGITNAVAPSSNASPSAKYRVDEEREEAQSIKTVPPSASKSTAASNGQFPPPAPPASEPVVDTSRRDAAVAPVSNSINDAPTSKSKSAAPGPAAPASAPAPAPAPSTSSSNTRGSIPTAPAPGLTAPAAKAEVASKTEPPAQALDDAEKKKAERAAYWKKVYERTTLGFAMVFGFIGLVCMGHPYVIILVLVLQVLVYREVTALFEIPGRPSITGGAPRRHVLSRHNSTSGGVAKSKKRAADAGLTASAHTSDDDDDEDILFREEERKELLWSKTLSWYFFTVANYFLYGESLIYYFKHIVFVDSYFIPFARHHRFLSFLLYIIGFVGFVSGLRRENLKHQFGLFGWVHMSLLLIVFSSHFLVNNILEGLIWLFVPASLVVCNDVFAYVCGMIWGKTPLISLSPKKTVEGFVGAFVITEVFAYGWATLFQRFNYMTCPAVSLGMNAFQEVHCQQNPVFLWHALILPQSISSLLQSTIGISLRSIPYTPFQLHSLVMAAFASLVAPFGGFFASGFKRAFNIKDFGDSIPGHGGLTDRFDCQFLMGLFSYVYYSSLIRENHVNVGSILQLVVAHLNQEEQVEAYREIGRFLAGRGIKV